MISHCPRRLTPSITILKQHVYSDLAVVIAPIGLQFLAHIGRSLIGNKKIGVNTTGHPSNCDAPLRVVFSAA